ncbi:type II toxin-antitoxin system HigB family toxin [Candidatus Finniella inopinata]|uniref:Type II toxin-antitoxin system HigB family toxin n=1 Tax=Candidatus Finniella inopinata TaxID=1696036 RepID=A0A4Q7DLQ0_9PROT|nr:type II toxin-antitoxin system HigB family toxin [Candidatus Finniella inopinata]RZI47114.1 type II toxin-antitoxin system HigB family toxin [Candidatus Finniella inopinata]
MRVISKRTLKQFWEAHSNFQDAKVWLQQWYADVEASEWKSQEDVKRRYRSASFLADNQIIFNVCGNRYRLIVKINYEYGIIYIRFIGTHAEYDQVNAKTI